MLDTKSRLVLKFINSECEGGAYKIIDAADIISALPQRFKIDSDGLEQILNHLEENDLVTIKYGDETVYCLSMLPKGRQILEENEREEKISRKASKTKISIMAYLYIFICALLGATIGTLIVRFIF